MDDSNAMTNRENDALRATNIEQAAEIGILRTEKHADAEAIGSQAAEIERIRAALGECMEEIDGYIRQEYPSDHPVHERYRKRDFGANPARIALAQEAQTNE